MRWSALLALLVVAAPVSAQDREAEKLYRAMEKKVRGAKTLHVVFEAEMQTQAFAFSFEGTIDFALGNKCRVRQSMDFAGNAFEELLISDDKQLYTKDGDSEKIDPQASQIKHLDKLVPGIMAPVGAGGLTFLRSSDNKQKNFDLDKDVSVKNFKLGAKEMVGKASAQVVTYDIDVKGNTVKASVWIDTQTQLPLKRVLTIEEGGKTLRITESSTLTLDEKLDPKLFEIPAR
jgi:outer membrane lipoprotein-sorting protein